MRGKFLLFLGFSAGYVLGSKAGRKRYEQIRSVANKVWNSAPVQNVATEAEILVGKVAPGVLDKIGQGTRYVVATVAGISTKPQTDANQEMIEREVISSTTGKSATQKKSSASKSSTSKSAAAKSSTTKAGAAKSSAAKTASKPSTKAKAEDK